MGARNILSLFNYKYCLCYCPVMCPFWINSSSQSELQQTHFGVAYSCKAFAVVDTIRNSKFRHLLS